MGQPQHELLPRPVFLKGKLCLSSRRKQLREKRRRTAKTIAVKSALFFRHNRYKHSFRYIPHILVLFLSRNKRNKKQHKSSNAHYTEFFIFFQPIFRKS